MMTQVHGVGSAFSYGRRYLTCLVFNIPTGDDDDGNAAGSREQPKYVTKKQVAEINKLIKSSGADLKKVVAYSQEGTVKSIPAESFGEIWEALKKRQAAVEQPEREPGMEGGSRD